jgi:hypothetical protein
MIPWNLENLSISVSKTIFDSLWWTVRWLLVLTNFVFLLIGLYSLYERRRKYRLLNYDAEFHWLVLALILGTSVLQALLIFADNWRFSVPYQPLIIYMVVVWLWLYYLRRRQRQAVSAGEGPDRAEPEDDGQDQRARAFLQRHESPATVKGELDLDRLTEILDGGRVAASTEEE